VGGVTVPPRQRAGGGRESGGRESGGTIVSPKQTTRPLIHEEEDGVPKFNFSAELQAELKDLGVYVSTWKHVEDRITAGWSETDVLALVDWMSKTRKDKAKAAQGFVTRVREGSKAPQEYYDFSGRQLARKWYPGKVETHDPEPEPDDEEPEYVFVQADETVTHEIEQAWQALLDQLSMEMPRASFSTWVQGSKPVHFETNTLQVACRNPYTRDWLESRLRSTVERLLVGILNTSVGVVFVVADGVAVETEME
jgi:DnaA-like protein